MYLSDLALVICKANKIEVRTLSANFTITFKNDDELWSYLKKAKTFGDKEVLFVNLNSPHSNKLEIVIE